MNTDMSEKLVSQQTTRMGELAISWQEEDQNLLGRRPDLLWDLLHKDKSWQLWQQPVSENWCGYPVTAFAVDDWQAWIIGELYGTSTIETVKSVLLGKQNAVDLNGHFQLWAWNKLRRRWHLWTNRFGTLHSYFASVGSQKVITTFYPAAATISKKQLDWNGLTGFFSFGFFPQDHTHYEDVKILKPATHYVFEADGHLSQQSRYWQWRYEPDWDRSYEDTVDQFADVFHGVMDDLVRIKRIAVPISGGLDSRSTVAALTRDGHQPKNVWSYSYGYENKSIELKIAGQVAESRHLPFSAFIVRPYLFRELPVINASLQGFQDITQPRQATVLNNLKSRAEAVIAAHWGDVWLNDMGLVEYNSFELDDDKLLSKVLSKLEKGDCQWLLRNLCQPQLAHLPQRNLIRDIMEPALTQYKHISEPDFRVKAFKTDSWSFRWTTASLRMYQPASFPRLPFYDTRLTDFFCTVPSAWVKNRGLQIDYLKRVAPDLANIIWQRYGVNLHQYPQRKSWALRFKRGLRRLPEILRGKIPITKNWQIQFLDENGRENLRNHLLQPGLQLHSYLAPSLIKTKLDEFYTAPYEHGGYALSMLLTFSVWLEEYG